MYRSLINQNVSKFDPSSAGPTKQSSFDGVAAKPGDYEEKKVFRFRFVPQRGNLQHVGK